MRLPRLLDGLAFRIGLLLTVALFPIGLIAVSLTNDIARGVEIREEGAILALTAEAAASEESLMLGARTVARGMAKSIPALLDKLSEGESCAELFGAFVGAGAEYSFLGYVDTTGKLRCASQMEGMDVSAYEATLLMEKNPGPRIDLRLRPYISDVPVILMQEPVRAADGSYLGYIALSVPVQNKARRVPQLPEARPLTFFTFNSEGTVLAANDEIDALGKHLPADLPITSFIGGPRSSFRARSVDGEERSYAVVPIMPGQLYAMGSWPVGGSALARSEAISPLFFVSLMWMVSLGVAFLAVHRLAIRNIADLRQRMSVFIATRRFSRSDEDKRKPLEFREITRTWEDLAETVVRDEAELENIIHGRTVLLKEVHHRVKNNLQLISSIVSMKIRKAGTPEARNALKEVQMRVYSISTVHQALYSTSTVALVEAHELLANIVSKTIEATVPATGAIRVETSFEPISLYPDQAVPLSLLTSEAVTNALKYLGRPKDGNPWLKVELRRLSETLAEVTVSNSIGAPLGVPGRVRATGLGLNLMRAFALQMRGTVKIDDQSPDQFVVRAEFHVSGFDTAPLEGSLPENLDWEAPSKATPRAEAG